MAQFHERELHGIELLTEKHRGERVAVVTHGGPIRALLLHCRGMPVNRYREVEKINNTTRTEVVLQKGKAIVHRVNDMTHLVTRTIPASSVYSTGN